MTPWLSLHVFRRHACDAMLRDCIAQGLERWRGEGLLRAAFFIRYWKGGPHIRLRLSPGPGAAEALRERALGDITAYLRDHPAEVPFDREAELAMQRKFQMLEYGTASPEELVADNSVKLIPYEAEEARFGGPRSLALAEEHFERSSLTALALLGAERASRLGDACRLMLLMGAGFGLDRRELSSYFGRYSHIWDAYLPIPRELAAQQFEQRFAHQRERLLALVQAVDSVKDALFVAWSMHAREIRCRIDELSAQNQLNFNGAWSRMIEQIGGVTRYFLFHFLHLTNNRVGVTPSEEAYLGFLLERALSAGREEPDAAGLV